MTGKRGKIRTATIDAQVADDLDAWISARADLLGHRVPALAGQVAAGDQPLFCTRTGARLSPGYLGDILQRLAKLDGSPLAGTAEWYVREETLRAANLALIGYHQRLPLTPVFGTGSLSSSDGQRFPPAASPSPPGR